MRHPRHPPRRHLVLRRPEMVIPAGRAHAGAISAGAGEPSVGPGNPGRSRLYLRETLQYCAVVFFGKRPRMAIRGFFHEVKDGGVPSAAHDRDLLVTFLP